MVLRTGILRGASASLITTQGENVSTMDRAEPPPRRPLSQRTVVIVVLVAVVSFATGAALMAAFGGRGGTIGQVDASTTPTASASAVESEVSTPTPTARPSTTPASTPSDFPSATPTPIPTPLLTPSPTPEPVTGVRWPLEMLAATVTHNQGLRSAPEVGPASIIHTPRLPKGTLLELQSGPVAGSGYWWYQVRLRDLELDGGVVAGWITASDEAGTEPLIAPAEETCHDMPFAEGEETATTLEQLRTGMQVTWAGCVTTPWDPPYPVTVTFRDDSTYTARRLLRGTWSGNGQAAFRNGVDRDSPLKIYTVDGLAGGGGFGTLAIIYDNGNPAPGSLRNIRLSGHQLSFDYYFKHEYGPIEFRLYRVTPGP